MLLLLHTDEARAKGVTRQMRGAEATKKCPEIVLVQVPMIDISEAKELLFCMLPCTDA